MVKLLHLNVVKLLEKVFSFETDISSLFLFVRSGLVNGNYVKMLLETAGKGNALYRND